jgi:hypothetical protein
VAQRRDQVEEIIFGKISIAVAEDRPVAEGTSLRTPPGGDDGGCRTPLVIQKGRAVLLRKGGKEVISRKREPIQIFDELPAGIYKNPFPLSKNGALYSLETPVFFHRLEEIQEGHLPFAYDPVIKNRVTVESFLRDSRNMRAPDKSQDLSVYLFNSAGDPRGVIYGCRGTIQPHVMWLFPQDILQGLGER